jgi:hypothetical protein
MDSKPPTEMKNEEFPTQRLTVDMDCEHWAHRPEAMERAGRSIVHWLSSVSIRQASGQRAETSVNDSKSCSWEIG